MADLAGLLRALLPRSCPGCGGQLGRTPGLCAECRAGVRPRLERYSLLSPRPEPHLVTLGSYRGVPRRAVRALKFGGARDLAGVLGGALAGGVPPGWGVGSVVPVPLHPRRERERGYNQSALLAEAVAASLGVPCVRAVRRTRATAQQARLRAHERAANLSGAFVADASRVPAGAVLLVDDVLTTGHTLLACRGALEAAGLGPVYFAVVAR